MTENERTQQEQVEVEKEEEKKEETKDAPKKAETLPVPLDETEDSIEVVTNKGIQLVSKASMKRSLASVRDGRYLKVVDGIMQCYDPDSNKICPLAFRTDVDSRTGEVTKTQICPYFKEAPVSCQITKKVYFQVLKERQDMEDLDPGLELDDLIQTAKSEFYASRQFETMKYGAPGTATLAWLKILKELTEAYTKVKKKARGVAGPGYDVAVRLKERREKITTTKKDGTTEQRDVVERTIENPQNGEQLDAEGE
jgi:hypothetical protein